MSGVLEVCINNIWNTVCISRFNENAAKVACRQMGFSGDNALDTIFRDEADTRPFSPTVPRCFDGSEAKLSDCQRITESDDCPASGVNVALECTPQGE